MAEFKLKKPTSNIHTEYDNYTDVEIISKLLGAVSQLRIYHFQSNSYAEHVALEVYKEIGDKLDGLAKTIQGKKKASLRGYKSYPYLEDDNPIKFLEELNYCLESYRVKLKTPLADNINSQIQLIQDSIQVTLYKLTFLK